MPEGRSSGPRKSIVTASETQLAREVIRSEERIRRKSNVEFFDRDERSPQWKEREAPLSMKADEYMARLPRRSSAPHLGALSSSSPQAAPPREELDIEAIRKRMGSLQMLQLGMGCAR